MATIALDRTGIGIGSKEIDLRDELENTFNGSECEIAKAYPVLVRRMRLSNGQEIPCVCNQNGEGSNDIRCSYCLGEGYYWDESWEQSFKFEIGSESAKARRINLAGFGEQYPHLTRFYFRYSSDIFKTDRVIELQKDANGEFYEPHTRGMSWRIHEVEEKRSDGGRLEYIVAYCSKMDVSFLNRKRTREVR